MNYKIIIALTSMLLFIGSVNATSLTVKLMVDSNNKIQVIDYRITSLNAMPDYDFNELNEEIYNASLLDSNAREISNRLFEVYFTTPNQDLNKVIKTLYLPFTGKESALEIKNKGKTLLWVNLQTLCNNNGTCNEFENYLSCPNDCNESNKDGVCNALNDNVCDEDCPKGIDIDCKEINSKETNKTNLISPTIITIIIILIIIGFYLIKKRIKPKKIKTNKRKKRIK